MISFGYNVLGFGSGGAGGFQLFALLIAGGGGGGRAENTGGGGGGGGAGGAIDTAGLTKIDTGWSFYSNRWWWWNH